MTVSMQKTHNFRIRKAETVTCLNGTLWLSAGGKDIILDKGDSVTWAEKASRAVIGGTTAKPASFTLGATHRIV